MIWENWVVILIYAWWSFVLVSWLPSKQQINSAGYDGQALGIVTLVPHEVSGMQFPIIPHSDSVSKHGSTRMPNLASLIT